MKKFDGNSELLGLLELLCRCESVDDMSAVTHRRRDEDSWRMKIAGRPDSRGKISAVYREHDSVDVACSLG
jgi:hypothetical protein